MADPNAILAITQPKLSIRKISHWDKEPFNDPYNPGRIKNEKIQNTVGFLAPYVEIDNYIIPIDKIISLSINQSGFLPELTISFIENNGLFSGMYFPRTNPILKLYIKSLSQAIKPIRSDYLITNVTSSEYSTIYDQGNRIESIYTVSAKMYIPGIYGNTVKSISKKKSWEALKQIADELQLGFATNETSTNDEMTWINPNDTVENFIKSICSRAYKDEKSFFDCFIDVNYILNFINYEKAIGKETKVMMVPGDAIQSQYSSYNSSDDITEKKVEEAGQESNMIPITLSSSIRRTHTGLHIAYYSMHSEHGEVLANQNFRKSILWHERKFWTDNKQIINHFIEPLSEKTMEAKDATYQKPKLANFDKEQTIRWAGIDYNNSHLNYKFSRLLNKHNLDELTKNYLVVKLPGLSQSIYRGGKLLVMIKRLVTPEKSGFSSDARYEQSDMAKLGSEEMIDVYLSGPYVVKDINYEFNAAPESSELRYSTELILVRREWVDLLEDNLIESEKTI